MAARHQVASDASEKLMYCTCRHAFTHVRDTSCADVKAKQRELPTTAQKVQRFRLGQCSPRVHRSQCHAVHETVQQRRQHASAVNVKRPSQPLHSKTTTALAAVVYSASKHSFRAATRTCTKRLANVGSSTCFAKRTRFARLHHSVSAPSRRCRRRCRSLVRPKPARQQRSPARLVESASQSSARFMSYASV